MRAASIQPEKFSSGRFGQFQLQQENNIMAFVNEYISDEDIKNYEIEKVWLRHNAMYIGKNKPAGFLFEWAIDHSRNIYFMVLTGPDRDDRYETCVLNLQGRQIILELRYAQGGSGSFSDNPFNVVWELRNAAAYDPEILEILKEALTIFGYDGMRRQVPNTIVKFKF